MVDIEKIPGDEGDTIELSNVLFIADGENYSIGKPNLEGTIVKATIVEQGKQKKIIVFKYKNKTRYRRKIGHRQHYTRLAIGDILTN